MVLEAILGMYPPTKCLIMGVAVINYSCVLLDTLFSFMAHMCK